MYRSCLQEFAEGGPDYNLTERRVFQDGNEIEGLL